MTIRSQIYCALSLVGTVLPLSAGPDFVKDIKPILEAHCIKCHGESKMEGELDLSYKEAALIGGEYGPAIVEGEADESILIQRITMDQGEDEVMPTKGRLLSGKEIQKLSDWIQAGAPWPEDLQLKEAKKKEGAGKKEEKAASSNPEK